MNFGLAFTQMYPNIQPSQYELMMQSDGSVKITQWNVTGTPQPNETDVINWWNSTGELTYTKNQKKAQLSASFDATMANGFSSSALGVSHTYPSDLQAMIFFNATFNRFNNDSTFTSVNQKTLDAGYLAHTKAQFTQVFNDGHEFGVTQDTKLANLKAQVDAATTVDAINAITW